MEDNELFELCKEVRRRTRWVDERLEKMALAGFESDESSGMYTECPLYTSDYILDKLPPAIWEEVSGQGQTVCLLTLNMQGNGEAIAVYTVPYDTEFRGSHQQRADTPLKALLKLVIALDKTDQLRKES